jgi:hypothetical protein
VCIENFIRIDLVRESPNVGHDGRADIPHLQPGCLSFPKIPSAGIRTMRQNQRIIRHDACHPPPAWKVCPQSVQVTASACSREPFSASSAQHCLEARIATSSAAQK